MSSNSLQFKFADIHPSRMKGRKDSFDFYLSNERHKQQSMPDSDDWLHDDQSEQQSQRDRVLPDRHTRPNASTAHSRDNFAQEDNTGHRRTSSEDNIVDLSSSENSYNLLAFIVKLLLHKNSLPLEEILDNVLVAYDNLGGKKGKNKVSYQSELLRRQSGQRSSRC